MLKICAWNINGIRSFSKPFKTHLDKLDADIICLQETKAGRDLTADYSRADGYNAYFAHCKLKPGYSGVCIFCREPLRPIRAYDNLLELLSHGKNHAGFDSSLDSEGRVTIVQFKTKFDNKLLSVISVYCPCADPENFDRVEFKDKFLQLLRLTICKLIEDGSYVVLAGDLNICHKPIDHCCPEDYMSLQRGPIEWLDSLLSGEESSMVDMFRFAHPDRQEAFTCWNTKTGARKTNYGTRIDYILFDKSLASLLPAIDGSIADIMADIEGSDHCPVWALLPLDLSINETSQLPPLCSHFWPQCQKRQLNLSVFLKNRTETENKEVGGGSVARTSICGAAGSKRVRQMRLDFTVRPQPVTSNSTELSEIKENEDEKVAYCETALEAEIERRKSTLQAWQNLLNGNKLKKAKSAPLCSGHREPCVLRCVKRLDSQYRGREFWACARPIGAPGNPLARCNTFIWK
ncbi:hypothetical protein Aperf_G00000066785 [Anoplocephala perfoliata]